jgi:hypothetical protein
MDNALKYYLLVTGTLPSFAPASEYAPDPSFAHMPCPGGGN